MSTEAGGAEEFVPDSGKPYPRKTRWIQLSGLAVVAGLIQLGLHYTYLPWWCLDSEGYSAPASVLYGSGFSKFPGERTPGYPLFLLACELVSPCRVAYWLRPESAQVITWVQSGLSVASVILLYLTIEQLQIRVWVNFTVSLLFALLIGVDQFAMIILSENLSVFVTILAVYLVVVCADRWRRGKDASTISLLAGLAFGAVIMVRPNLLPVWLSVALAIPVLVGWKLMRHRRMIPEGAILQVTRPLFSGGLVVILAWLFVHYENEGVVGLTEVTDLTRTSAAYNLFDQVHPKDKVLGEIMVKYYRQGMQGGHEDRSYIWRALPEIDSRANEMPLPVSPKAESFQVDTLYEYIGRVSNQLLLEHPGTWAKNSFSNLVGTFNFNFGHTNPGELKDPVSLTKIPVIVSVEGWKILCLIEPEESWLIFVFYILTFVALPLAIYKTLIGWNSRESLASLAVAALSLGVLTCMALMCILAIYDVRYSVPLISIFVICSAYVTEHVISIFAKKARKLSPPRLPC